MDGRIVFIIFILIVIFVNVLKWLFKVLAKAAQGPAFKQMVAGAQAQREEGRVAPPEEIRRFLEQARRRQAAPARPPQIKKPRGTVRRRVVPVKPKSAELHPEADLGELGSRLARRHIRGRLREEATAQPVVKRRRAAGTSANEISGALFKPSRDTLRKAVIWSEILGKPISMRMAGGRTLPFREPVAGIPEKKNL